MNNDTHPYTLDVMPSPRLSGHFDWVIRKQGKLVQRSDRPHRTEEDARKIGAKEIERQFTDARATR